MNAADANKPIVVKRVKKYAAGAHGGAWKVAFADFVTAMMALFLVLWLIESTTPAEKMAISMYFSDPTGYTDGGSPFVINLGGGMRNTDAIDRVSSPAPPTQEPDVDPDKNTQPNLSQEAVEQAVEQVKQMEQQQQLQEMHEQQENNKFEELKQMLEERIEADPTLGALKDQIIIKITEEGLLIEVVDKDKRPMFDSGGDVIKPYMRTILKEISKTMLDVPNPLSVTGHTDAVPFTEVENYSNWELSADRANAARRAMLRAGIKEKQISRVVGLADSQLYDKAKPENPINRRISILAMRTPINPPPPSKDKKPEDEGKKGEAADESGFPGGVIPGADTGKPAAAPAIDPNLPPDADFPTGFDPAASRAGAVPESVPAVPTGLTPQPVLSAPGGSTVRESSTPPVNLDPFSAAPTGNAAPSRPAATAAPANPAARAPAGGAPAFNAPATSAPAAAPARAAPGVTVPRPSAPDEEFF